MASNGSTSVAVTTYDTLKFNWTQVSQSISSNSTVVHWTLQLVSGSAGAIISSVAKQWSVTVNGTTYTGTNSVAIGNSTAKTLASGQTTIAHNADGSKSFNYSFSQEFSITFAGESIGTKSGSGSGVLNTIARATTPTISVTSVDMGTTIAITTPRASDRFTHDIAYSFAGSGYFTIENGVTLATAWTVPTSLAYSIPNATSGTVTIRCITKDGTTTVGTKTALLTVKVPTAVKPLINSVTATEATSGLSDRFGAFIQSKSAISVSIDSVGAFGSTIKSYSSTFHGKTYTGASWKSDVITLSGTLSIVTSVTDSRGRTATTTTNISVLSYAPPKITAFHVARYNRNGVADPDGDIARIRLAYSVTPLNNKNTASAKVEMTSGLYNNSWKALETWTDLSFDMTYQAGIQESGTRIFSTDYQWEFRVTLTDAFNSATPATYTAVLPSGAVILDIKADGKGIAFFKTSTREGVEITGELPGSAKALVTNDDLNNLTSPGFYVIPTTVISQYIKNKPYTDSATASIEVKQTGTGMVKQILQKSTKTDGVIYERGYDSSGWGAWSIVYAGAGKVLWTGNYVMNASQSVSFSEPLSQQQNGIVLVFSRYATTGEQNYAYSSHFISKLFVTTAGGTTGVNLNLIMATTKFDYIAGKTLTVTDTGITGHTDNTATGKADISGITYYNDKFALRYVIGV